MTFLEDLLVALGVDFPVDDVVLLGDVDGVLVDVAGVFRLAAGDHFFVSAGGFVDGSDLDGVIFLDDAVIASRFDVATVV